MEFNTHKGSHNYDYLFYLININFYPLVAIVGIAVAISKEAREWYKATKKEKRQNPTRKRRI